MEALEKAQQRASQKLDPKQVLKPVTVTTASDIKRVVAEFDPHRNPEQVEIPLETFLEAQEDGKKNVYQVSASTKSKSKRDMLVEGLTIVKNREEAAGELQAGGEEVEINGRPMRPAKLNSATGRTWVDPLIVQWTGGRRDGTYIVWDLEDGFTYKYDIFAHRLSRVARG
jgi:hypothetical protein